MLCMDTRALSHKTTSARPAEKMAQAADLGMRATAHPRHSPSSTSASIQADIESHPRACRGCRTCAATRYGHNRRRRKSLVRPSPTVFVVLKHKIVCSGTDHVPQELTLRMDHVKPHELTTSGMVYTPPRINAHGMVRYLASRRTSPLLSDQQQPAWCKEQSLFNVPRRV
jgi:hypothetical protein